MAPATVLHLSTALMGKTILHVAATHGVEGINSLEFTFTDGTTFSVASAAVGGVDNDIHYLETNV